ncbi:CrcB family protein [Yimella sp. cx-51]|uniref:fluoride efflux transporter FluC n=1 Tax=Yimella sp. cx-51 TaxID=2770551 RepID=UPI00165DE737|nr:CrcB family protein [Yimella sp. cx-51]MBC9955510.1 CrcB family protein [Yimella sp. cx-51]QTH37904.1 CrcB family protein [Yimella sp. cx-51]
MTWWIALAGGLGAGLRFLLDSWLTSRVRARVPIGSLAVNVLGSFVLGLLVGHFGHDPQWTRVAGVGLMGGFTTFSAASVESARLLTAPKMQWLGLAHAIGVLVASVTAAFLGYWLGGL